MMILGVILAALGLVCALSYSALVGLLFVVVGGSMVAKGYFTTPPSPPSSNRYEGGGSMSYDISSKPRR